MLCIIAMNVCKSATRLTTNVANNKRINYLNILEKNYVIILTVL